MQFQDFVDFSVARGRPGERNLAIYGLGLAGETGEAVEHVKKYLRDSKPLIGNTKFALELGDIMFYWLQLVVASGFTPQDIFDMNVEKLTKRDAACGGIYGMPKA